jgi:hypothetical protein
MRAARPRATLLALLVAVLVAVAAPLAAPVAGIVEPVAARGAATDLTLVTDATYTVQPEAGHVSVSMALAAKNHTTETRTRKFWFDHGFLAVQPGATNLRISGHKGARVRVAKRTADATLLRIDFGSRLYSGKGATFRLAFDLPGQGKAASPQVRVGTSLITLPVWAFASNGARGSSVTVRLPAGWDAAVETGSFRDRTTGADGTTILATGPLSNPLTFFAFVSAQRPAVYVDHPLTVAMGSGQADLVIRALEDDSAWAKRTGELVGATLPVLGRDIGLAWPLDRPLVVQESVSREAGAPAGSFDPAAGRIELAYWADPGVAIHQAAHAWFQGTLLADRWANEGFASYYALRAASELKEEMASPAMTDEARAAKQPLNAWAQDTAPGTAADAYGYAASLELAGALADAVGPDVLAATWADAAARLGAYQPPATAGATAATATTPENVDGAPDWHGLLDLLEANSGQDLVPLWREWVVTPEQALLLQARADARASYARTLAVAGDWQLPRPIRDALRAWQFDTAEALMRDARTVVAQRNAVTELAARDGVALPDSMRGLFESGSLADASALAEDQRGALLAIEQAAAVRSVDDDILSRVGMLGEHPDADLAEAKTALADGDIDTSLAASDRAYRAWTVAWQEGRRRALLALAVLATVIVLGSAVIGSLRRSRRRVEPAGSASEPGGPASAAAAPPSPGDGAAPA